MSMSWAVKYRPRSLDDVIAQDGTVGVLRQMVKSDRVNAALLFHGPKGSGKTSVARIVAKAVQCEDPSNRVPCGRCGACTSDWDDTYELDAASNRGVQAMLDLLKQVGYRPRGKKKVYIIDEAHMLTPEAMSAFLKMLEEPPSHVLFILATTDRNALLPTVRSRCLGFAFRPFSDEALTARLAYICKSEKIRVEPRALRLIAERSERSMRDAIMILEACVSDGVVSEKVVVSMYGGTTDKTLLAMARLVLTKGEKASARFFVKRQDRIERGVADEDWIGGLCGFVRDASMYSYCPDIGEKRPLVMDEKLQGLFGDLRMVIPIWLSNLWYQYRGRRTDDIDVMFLEFRDRIENPDRYARKEIVYRETHQVRSKRAPAESLPVDLPFFMQKLGSFVEQVSGRTTIRSPKGRLLDIVNDPSFAKHEYYIELRDVKLLRREDINGFHLERKGLIKKRGNECT